MKGYYKPPVTSQPVPLDQKRADIINYLMGHEYPATGRVVSSEKYPLTLAGRYVAEATAPSKQRISIPEGAPKYGLGAGPRSAKRAERLGIIGQEIAEVNPHRAELRRRLKRDVNLHSVKQWLNLSHVAHVELAPEQPPFKPNTLTIAAGFRPLTSTGPEGTGQGGTGQGGTGQERGGLADQIDRWSSADQTTWLNEVAKFRSRYGAGYTGHAYEYGSRARDVNDLRAIYDHWKAFSELAQDALKRRDFANGIVAANRAQWLREMWEAATGTRITGEEGPTSAVEGIRRRYDPTYRPPLEGVTPDDLLKGEPIILRKLPEEQGPAEPEILPKPATEQPEIKKQEAAESVEAEEEPAEGGPVEDLTRPNFEQVIKLPKEEQEKYWPEAVNDDVKRPYDFLKAPVLKDLSREQALDKAAEMVTEEYREAAKDPATEKYRYWYERAYKVLSKIFGDDLRIIVELLAALSPRNSVLHNVRQAIDYYINWKAGKYDNVLKAFDKGLQLIDSGEMDKIYPDKKPFEQLNAYLKDNVPDFARNISILRDVPAFKVLLRRWYENTEGPKVKAYADALYGDKNATVVDIWISRGIHRILWSATEKKWRYLPKNETTLPQRIYEDGAEILRRAAKRLDMPVAHLQALMWGLEIEKWVRNNWLPAVHVYRDIPMVLKELNIEEPEHITALIERRKRGEE